MRTLDGVTDRVIIDGRPGGADDLGLAMAARYGHFTAMQVRGGRVRGLDLHLARLTAATRELFGASLDRDLVVGSIGRVLGDVADAGVRVYVVERDGVRVIATAAEPHRWPDEPRSLMSATYARFLPHIKHLGGLPQVYLGRRAESRGFDDALLVGTDGLISEGTIANLGCFDGERVVWPDAPMLRGVSMGLLDRVLPGEHRPLRVADLAGHPLVFLSNSWGIVPVGRVDDLVLKVDEDAWAALAARFDAVPWDPIA
ncbi:MAG: class aminotransferase [Nonomuraea muscovyensis]|nr:class aminotransferase [Nonomuraea muscovyensis]